MVAIAQEAARQAIGRKWIIIFLLAIFLSLFTVGAFFMGVDEGEFEQSTGLAWSELTNSQPEVGDYIIRLERLSSAGSFGLGLLWATLVFGPFRRGERWSWYVLWTMPMVFGLSALLFILDGAVGLGGFYLVQVLLVVLVLLLSRRVFFPQDAAT